MQKALHSSPHTDIAQSMNNLASLLYSMHNYSEAKILYEDSLSMLIELLGNDNVEVAQAMNNLAALLFAKKSHREAESLYIESLRIRRQALGSDHLDVASSLCNLGILKRSTREYGAAEEYFKESLEIRSKILKDDNHTDVKVCRKHLAYLKQLTVAVEIGMRVEVNDRSSGQLLVGQVISKHSNNSYDIRFDDPDLEIATNIPRNRLAVLKSVENNSSSKVLQSRIGGNDRSPLSDSVIQRDRVLNDFQKAGNKVVRRKKSIEETPVDMPKKELHKQQSNTGSSSASTDSSMSSNSGSALEEILEKSRRKEEQTPASSPEKPSPGRYTKLKTRSPSTDDKKIPANNGIPRHVSSHRKSRELSHSSSLGDESEQRARYRESVGVATSRRSQKSFKRSAAKN